MYTNVEQSTFASFLLIPYGPVHFLQSHTGWCLFIATKQSLTHRIKRAIVVAIDNHATVPRYWSSVIFDNPYVIAQS